MNTPYEDLGLEPNATFDQIRAAYRKLAMRHHPDRQGDPVEFKKVQNAYAVLSDPERRLQFDTTGSTEKMMTLRQAAERLVPEFAQQALAECALPEWTDVHALIVAKVYGSLRNDREQQSKGTKERALVQKLIKRFTRKGSGENMIAGTMQARISVINQYLEANTEHQLLMLEVLEVMKDYSYHVGDMPETLTLHLEGML